TLDVMQINPGLARKEDWQSVSYKGGGDSGVFNLTTGLVAKDGIRYCISATWNDVDAVDQWTFFTNI
ncbi:MAG: serine hydrolase, partial [Parvibaculum sp.]|nr:serine hydrolase [Parvibaculum sp.]